MKPVKMLTGLAVAVALLGTAPVRSTHADEAVYRKVLPSTVWIVTPRNTMGSGALVDQQRRLVVTNFHVIDSISTVRVFFPQYDNKRLIARRMSYLGRSHAWSISGRVVAADPKRDLALIQLAKLPASAVPIKLADRGASPGQTVHSIGNPGASRALWVYTSGTVRQVYRKQSLFSSGQQVNATILETQSPVNRGDSGGPVVNGKGELVAVTSSYTKDARLVTSNIHIKELKALLKGENSSVDPRLAGEVKKMNRQGMVSRRGSYYFAESRRRGNWRGHVFVSSSTKTTLGLETRQVSVKVHQFAGPVPAEIAQVMLASSARQPMSRFVVLKTKSGPVLGYVIDLPADSGAGMLDLAIRKAADVASALKSRIRKQQQKDLVGRWSLRRKNATHQNAKARLQLNNDGTFQYETASLTLSGRYSFSKNVLTLWIGGKTILSGSAKWTGSKRRVLTLKSAKQTMVLTKSQTSNPPTVAAASTAKP